VTTQVHDDAPGGTAQAAQQVADQAQQQAQQAADQVRSQVRAQVDQRSTQVGEQVSGHAGDLRSVGEQLREQGKDGPARLADEAADRAERLGRYLAQSDGDTLLSDLEDAARSNPWAVAFGGLALGFAASRLLKASSGERYEAGHARQLPAPRDDRPAPRPAPAVPPAPVSRAGGPAAPDLAAAGGGAGSAPLPFDGSPAL
jgi:gas vesicle protein